MLDKRAVQTSLVLIGVLLLATFFRLYDLKNYPPGLFPDQAANGEDALLILQGDWQPFYERGNGREGLFFYLQAILITLFGIGVWPMFAASALVGVATVVATYFAARVWFGRLAGVLAALLLASSYWQVTLSRTGFRAILIPFFMATFTAFLGYTIVAEKHRRPAQSYLFAVAAGIAFAGGFYSYIAYRVMMGVMLGVAVLWLIAAAHHRIDLTPVRRYGRQLIVSIAAAGVLLLPLGVYMSNHPAALWGRAGQVSIFNPALQEPGGLIPTFLTVTNKTILSFFVGSGDMNWRHSVAGYPLLSPLVGILLLLGIIWTLVGVKRVFFKIGHGQQIHLSMIYPYTLLMFAGMLLPVVTTAESIPHGLRSIGLAFPIFFVSGMAGAVIIHWLMQQPKSILTALSFGVIAGLIASTVLYDGALYFVVARNDRGAWAAYRGDLTEVAAWLKEYKAQAASAERPYLVLDGYSQQTVHFLTSAGDAHDHASHPDESRHLYRAVEPSNSASIRLAEREVIVFTKEALDVADRYAATYPSGELEVVAAQYNRFGQEVLRVYRKVAPAVPSPADGASLDA